LEGPFDRLAGELAAAGEQIGLPDERGGAERVQRVEGLSGCQGSGGRLQFRRHSTPLRTKKYIVVY
jgi:hypothetical protein